METAKIAVVSDSFSKRQLLYDAITSWLDVSFSLTDGVCITNLIYSASSTDQLLAITNLFNQFGNRRV
jgi:hypothetical protein